MIEETGPIGIWKYRSIMTRMSAAYAELAPDDDSTLSTSISLALSEPLLNTQDTGSRSWEKAGQLCSPDKYRFLDTEWTRIELHP